jgi:hypothetical protein
VIIEDFLTARSRQRVPPSLEADPLRERGALEGAALLDVRMSAVWTCAWLLFDCKGALNIQEGNSALLVAHNVSRFSWVCREEEDGPKNRAVERWELIDNDVEWGVEALLWRNVTLTLQARHCEFFVGDVPGGDDAPPDYVADDDETIRAGLASWTSPFEPYYMTNY